MVVRLENVVKSLQGNTVIDSISFEQHSPQIVGLQGVNGSGKTMLLRLLCGLIAPTSGRVLIDGKLLDKEHSFPESTGILIETPAFLDDFTAFDNLKLISRVNNLIGDDDIHEVLSRVGLESSSKKKYRKFSLGMKERLGIAAAIMESPKLLLLDEPTNALDTSGIDLLKDILLERKDMGSLSFIASHDSDILREVCDEILCMDQGKIVEKIVLKGDPK